MKVVVIGSNKSIIQPIVISAGLSVVEEDPEYVISYGGDGTLMLAESLYPGIPKILLKDSHVCKKCSVFSNAEVLSKVIKRQFRIETLDKLEVNSGNQKLCGMNDIIVHNQDPRHAIRYSLAVNDKSLDHLIIGDGVVVATPFGSSAYYRSITDSFFEVGIGLAFNNSTEQSDHLVLKDNSIIKIKIIRGPAVVYADNQADYIEVESDQTITIGRADTKTSLIIPL